MIELLTRNAGLKLFSLVVSLMLWYTFARDPEVGGFVSVPVEYRGMPDNLEISSDLVNAVSIDLRGPSEKVVNFSAAKSAVVLDFSGIHKPGEQTFSKSTIAISTCLPACVWSAPFPAQIRLPLRAPHAAGRPRCACAFRANRPPADNFGCSDTPLSRRP